MGIYVVLELWVETIIWPVAVARNQSEHSLANAPLGVRLSLFTYAERASTSGYITN